MHNKVLFIQNFNAILSLAVIVGTMMEYEFYYFDNFYILNKENQYEVKKDGEKNYSGMQYRLLFSLICGITAFMSIYSSVLEFRLKKLQGNYYEGI